MAVAGGKAWSAESGEGSETGVEGVVGGLGGGRKVTDRGSEAEHQVEVVCWNNEEGSRFAPPMVASGVFAGIYDLDMGDPVADFHGHGKFEPRLGLAGFAIQGLDREHAASFAAQADVQISRR